MGLLKVSRDMGTGADRRGGGTTTSLQSAIEVNDRRDTEEAITLRPGCKEVWESPHLQMALSDQPQVNTS